MSGLDVQVGRNRGAGISIAFFVQTDYGTSPHLLPNINGWLMGRTGERDALTTLGRKLGLSDAQIEWLWLNLRRGQFVGVVVEGDWHEPFVFESTDVDLAHAVTEADVLESQLPLAALPVIPDEQFRNWERHPLAELQPDTAQPALASGPQKLLDAVLLNPGKPAGHYAQTLGLNGKAARAARQRLVQLGLLREHKVQLNPRGKSSIVLEPLPAARAFSNATPEGI